MVKSAIGEQEVVSTAHYAYSMEWFDALRDRIAPVAGRSQWAQRQIDVFEERLRVLNAVVERAGRLTAEERESLGYKDPAWWAFVPVSLVAGVLLLGTLIWGPVVLFPGSSNVDVRICLSVLLCFLAWGVWVILWLAICYQHWKSAKKEIGSRQTFYHEICAALQQHNEMDAVWCSLDKAPSEIQWGLPKVVAQVKHRYPEAELGVRYFVSETARFKLARYLWENAGIELTPSGVVEVVPAFYISDAFLEVDRGSDGIFVVEIFRNRTSSKFVKITPTGQASPRQARTPDLSAKRGLVRKLRRLRELLDRSGDAAKCGGLIVLMSVLSSGVIHKTAESAQVSRLWLAALGIALALPWLVLSVHCRNLKLSVRKG